MFFLKDKKVPNESDRLKQVKYHDEPQNQDKYKYGAGLKVPDTSKQTLVDISKQIENENHKPFNIQSEPLDIDSRELIDQDMIISFVNRYKQFAVYNPTGRTIRLSLQAMTLTGGLATDYRYTVGANKLAVFLPINFNKIYIHQETYTPSSIVPTLVAYPDRILTPIVSSL